MREQTKTGFVPTLRLCPLQHIFGSSRVCFAYRSEWITPRIIEWRAQAEKDNEWYCVGKKYMGAEEEDHNWEWNWRTLCKTTFKMIMCSEGRKMAQCLRALVFAEDVDSVASIHMTVHNFPWLQFQVLWCPLLNSEGTRQACGTHIHSGKAFTHKNNNS